MGAAYLARTADFLALFKNKNVRDSDGQWREPASNGRFQIAPGGFYPHPNTASTNVHCLFIRDACADGQEPASARAMRPTDSIAQIEQQLAHAYPAAPPADTQRLLLKTTNSTTTKAEMASDDSKPRLSIDLKESPSLSPSTRVSAGRGNQRIPSVVLSPSPSAEAPPGDLPSSSGSSSPSIRSRQNSTTRDITLTLNNAAPVLAVQELSTYHASIANPPVLVGPARVSGTSLPPADAPLAFEFLRAAKGMLTIARVREPGGRHRHGRVLGGTQRMGGF
ncbi:hypothetical protein C8J57DRAFT_1732380 [Mycena rebaudengoi]|nr:hypothetical protein C8J57DRAFT_1732380 [Mycena rebaudengoi]